MTAKTLNPTHFSLIAIVAFLLGTPVLGAAQVAEEMITQPTIYATIEGPDVLRAKAVELFEDVSRTERAAHVLRQESEQRTADDPQAFNAFVLSGRMFGYAGELIDAQRMIEDAAWVALMRGEIEKSANAFIDAAWVAQQRGKNTAVRELLFHAELLTESPYLTAEKRDAILRRIGEETSGTVALNR